MAKRTFHYHASAHALSGQFWRPFQRVIEVQAPTTLPSIGGVGKSRVDNFRLDDLVSFKAGYTHVLGSKKELIVPSGALRARAYTLRVLGQKGAGSEAASQPEVARLQFAIEFLP